MLEPINQINFLPRLLQLYLPTENGIYCFTGCLKFLITIISQPLTSWYGSHTQRLLNNAYLDKVCELGGSLLKRINHRLHKLCFSIQKVFQLPLQPIDSTMHEELFITNRFVSFFPRTLLPFRMVQIATPISN